MTTVTSFSGLQTSISQLAGGPGVIELAPGIYSVTSNYTVPSTVTLLVNEGAVFDLSSLVTLTLDGSLKAGRQQVFSGLGTVSGRARIETVLPEWFYSGTGTWNEAINKSLVFAVAVGKLPVSLGVKTYNIDGPLTLGAEASLVGVDSRSSIIRRSANDFTMITMSSLSALRRITVDGNTAPPPGTRPGMQQRAGVVCHGLSNANIEDCDFEDLIVKNNLGQGISFQYAANARLRNITVSGNWERGINISAFSHHILASDIRGSNNLNSDIVIGWGSHSNVISNCVLDLTSNTGLWLAQDVHDNNISNVRIHSPHSTAYQGMLIANAYKNHLLNVSIGGFPLGVLLRSTSVTCYTYGPPALWDDDTRDNIISNLNVDGANATAGIQFDAAVTSTQNVAGEFPNCGFKKVMSNIVSNVTIDNVADGVLATSAQGGTADVTNNTIANGVFHNVSGVAYNWGKQTGNIVR